MQTLSRKGKDTEEKKKKSNKSLKFDKWQILAWLPGYAKILADFSVIHNCYS